MDYSDLLLYLQGFLLWAEPRDVVVGANFSTSVDEGDVSEGRIHCHYFSSWQANESELSWADKAQTAEGKGASAVVFITESKDPVVPEVVPKTLTETPEMQVGIPVVFVARGVGGDLLMEATQQQEHATLDFDQLRHFAAVTADEFASAGDTL